MPRREADEEQKAERHERFLEYLAELEASGMTQQAIAARAKVPPQYLSDVKTGRRPLSELFARRLCEEFGGDYARLLGRHAEVSNSSVRNPMFRDPIYASIRLPVLNRPTDGDPAAFGGWDGTLFELSGAAAARAQTFERPYILRIGFNDEQGRLRRGDLVLVVPERNSRSGAVIIVGRGGPRVARFQRKSGLWSLIEDPTREVPAAEAEVVGRIEAIVWGTLS